MSKWRYINENSQVFITQKINTEKMPVLIWGQQGGSENCISLWQPR